MMNTGKQIKFFMPVIYLIVRIRGNFVTKKIKNDQILAIFANIACWLVSVLESSRAF